MLILKILWMFAIAVVLIYSQAVVFLAIRERAKKHHSSKLRPMKLINAYQYFQLTFIGGLLALVLYFPTPQEAISKLTNIDALFVEAGAMIGTIIALIFSLSIIAIQRAAETFTPSISRLYREDRTTQFLFVTLVVLCMFSFIFSVNKVLWGIPQSKLLPVQVIFIGLTFDLSRMHYRRISHLMDTNVAIDLLFKDLTSHIKHTKKTVSKEAKKYLAKTFAGKNGAGITTDNIEAQIYRANPRHVELLASGLGEMAEIANRAVSKGEYYAAGKAISSITDTTIHYLDTRRNNLVISSVAAMPLSGLVKGDVGSILSPIYEYLMEINRKAVENKAQTVSIKTIESLGAISIHLVRLGGQFPKLTWEPLGYLGYCVTHAQESQLHEVPLRASNVLLNFGLAIPDDYLDIYIYLPIFERWKDIVRYSLLSQNTVVADIALQQLMSLILQLQRRHQFLIENILPIVLADIYKLIPLCLANEQPSQSPFSPYAMTNLSSLGYLVQEASTRIERSEDEWTTPYANFLKLNERVSRHFRNIANNYDIGTSTLLWHISQTIEHISKVYLKILDRQVTENHSWNTDLADQLRWYITFFWNAFDKAKIVGDYNAFEACQIMGWIGLTYYERGFPEVARSAINSIASVSNSLGNKGEVKHPNRVTGVLAFVLQLRILAEAKEDISFIQNIDKELNRLEILKGENEQYSNELQRELKKLKRDIASARFSPFGDEPLDLLINLLMKKYPAMFQKILGEVYGK